MNGSKQRMTSKRTTKSNRRIFGQWLFFIVIAMFALLVIRFAYVSLGKKIDHVDLTAAAEKLYTANTRVSAKRGSIYDANGSAIAEDTSTYTLYAVLAKNQVDANHHKLYVTDKLAVAKGLAHYLPISETKVLKTLEGSGNAFQVEFGTAGKNISVETKNKIEALKLTGIHFTRSEARLYPNGTFASHLVGITNAEPIKHSDMTYLKGTMGIELAFNKQLAGKDGIQQTREDSYGQTIGGHTKSKKAVDGNEIYTTIDSKLQTLLETKMTQINQQVSPKNMTATLMDAKTGAILASSQRPTFNASTRSGISKMWRNLLVEDTYEPGSTMKVFTLAAAINSHNLNDNITFPTGEYRIDNQIVPDWNTSGWGNINYSKGFAISSNTAMARLQQTMGAKTWYSYIKKFGLRSGTNTGLNNEQSGSIQFKYPIEQADTAFGQGIQVTPMQMMRGFSAIANNGKMLQPYFIKKIVNPNTDHTTFQAKTKTVGQPVTAKTASRVLSHMEDVAYKSYGTGIAYKLPGTKVAVKTGTAQVSNGSTYEQGNNSYLYSVVGMAPAKHPRYVLYITMKQPQLGSNEASKLMAEIFKPVMQRALAENSNSSSSAASMPSVIDKSTSAAKKAVKAEKASPIVIGNGKRIVKQSVVKGEQLASEQKVLLLTDGQMTMPDLTNWSASDVADFAQVTGLKLSTSGTGYVTSQSIESGNPIDAKQALRVTLKGE